LAFGNSVGAFGFFTHLVYILSVLVFT